MKRRVIFRDWHVSLLPYLFKYICVIIWMFVLYIRKCYSKLKIVFVHPNKHNSCRFIQWNLLWLEMDSVTGTSVSIFTVAFHVHLALCMNHTPPKYGAYGQSRIEVDWWIPFADNNRSRSEKNTAQLISTVCDLSFLQSSDGACVSFSSCWWHRAFTCNREHFLTS